MADTETKTISNTEHNLSLFNRAVNPLTFDSQDIFSRVFIGALSPQVSKEVWESALRIAAGYPGLKLRKDGNDAL